MDSETNFESTFNSKYSIGKKLGQGAYAVVCECVHRETQERFAVKIVDTSKVGPKDVDDITHEISVMEQIGYHPHILQMRDYYITESNIYIVLDLVKGGMLFDKLVELKHYSEQDAARLVRRLLSALAHMHKNNICHRDLKPENLLLKLRNNKQAELPTKSKAEHDVLTSHKHSVLDICTEDHTNLDNEEYDLESKIEHELAMQTESALHNQNEENVCYVNKDNEKISECVKEDQEDELTNVCVADFGLAGIAPCYTCCGSPAYIAPEVIKVGYLNTQLDGYDVKCDIWSLGVITYILLSGKMPFHGRNFKEIFRKIVNNDLNFSKSTWQNVSPRAIEFIQQCLVAEPVMRPSAEDLLQHPWILEKQSTVHLESSLQLLREFTAQQKVRAAVRVFCFTHNLLGTHFNRTPPFMRYLRHDDKFSTILYHQSQTHSNLEHKIDFSLVLTRRHLPYWKLQECCTCKSEFICRHLQNVHEYLFVGCRAQDVFPFLDELNMMLLEESDKLHTTDNDTDVQSKIDKIEFALKAANVFSEELSKVPYSMLKPNLMLEATASKLRVNSLNNMSKMQLQSKETQKGANEAEKNVNTTVKKLQDAVRGQMHLKPNTTVSEKINNNNNNKSIEAENVNERESTVHSEVPRQNDTSIAKIQAVNMNAQNNERENVSEYQLTAKVQESKISNSFLGQQKMHSNRRKTNKCKLFC